MSQLHKKFTDEQMKELFGKYTRGEVERKYIQEILGIGKSRFFTLVREYRDNHKRFSIQYEKTGKTRQISPEIEENILKELGKEKKLIADEDMPILNGHTAGFRTGLSESAPEKTLLISKQHNKYLAKKLIGTTSNKFIARPVKYLISGSNEP